MKPNTKQLLLQRLPKAWLDRFLTAKSLWQGDYLKLRRRLEETERALQMVTAVHLSQYHTTVGDYWAHDRINRHEARIYSQNGEDGLLLYLFSRLGTTDRRFVEFGIGNGRQCNSANLSLNFGWSGLLLDIDPANVIAARAYYQQRLGDNAPHVQISHSQVTAENINHTLTTHGFSGNLDLLSIDIDSNDYWVWQAITVIQPRVVVIEYNASLGAERAITIPYNPHFRLRADHPSGFYHGASLAALVKLGQEKGYVLVGCDSQGANAFFVRQDVQGDLPTQTAAEAYFPHAYRTAQHSPAAQFQMVAHLPFIEVA